MCKEAFNVKPVAVEKIDLDENVVKLEEHRIESGKIGNDVNNERLNASVNVVIKEESEVKKDAWRLLRNAVVTYCGSPVGTVAANDPNDKVLLNYDQVFLRDFIPSAFAFLLRGEGEIVRNFLLRTLQLQAKSHFNLVGPWWIILLRAFGKLTGGYT